jgi:hypothetical protein
MEERVARLKADYDGKWVWIQKDIAIAQNTLGARPKVPTDESAMEFQRRIAESRASISAAAQAAASTWDQLIAACEGREFPEFEEKRRIEALRAQVDQITQALDHAISGV